MEILIWIGAAVSLVGLVGILYCASLVAKAKGAGLDDAGLRDRLRQIVALNLGALFVSAIGLMLVVIGITFK
ncbi:hypothetical protein C8J27_10710 [Rhodobacter aestuarii]|uniref:Uncharacterized protein n=1 Tax=Rhodobacter aestuarii TaxID=453582 RepID=A0A1N7NXM5_9RHOB|nr:MULTISPECIES: hypothetical protein [Rhodobacter]PTV94481.1 hypothetical protein C8J27_10710 [Rhodobacter aestuarii]SIT03064.1 hypothetical protein SAMN05421580_108217 [Rhodobacter aestuarii]SOC12137.1 hypothetical protein SAMN05877809_10610 [Rhodobacter sp. JA431]